MGNSNLQLRNRPLSSTVLSATDRMGGLNAQPSQPLLTDNLRRWSRAAEKGGVQKPIRTRQTNLTFDRFSGKGKLDSADPFDPNYRSRYYYEDWQLPRNVKPGQLVEVTLSTRQFDAYLYLAKGVTRRGQPLIAGLDTRATDGTEVLSTNSRLIFTVKPNQRYFLRATTTQPREQGRYTIRYRVFRNPSQSFNFFYGAGLVDAAAAVGEAVGRGPITDSLPLGGEEWGRDLVKAPAVWAQGWTGKDVTVAVIDTGVDYTHPDLKNNIWTNLKEVPANGIDDDQNGYIDDVRGWDFVDGDNDPNDLPSDGHGTHVAGTIAAARDGAGVTGVAPDAKVMPIRVIDNFSSDAVYNARLVQGIDYAVQNGAKVINLSLRKGVRYDFELGAALQRANQAGVTVVIASGNGRQDEGMIQPFELGYRAMLNNLGLAVGAIDRSRRMALFSNPAGRAPGRFVVAPGVSILSTIPNNQYATFDGTSMATPHTVGVVALLLSANPALTPNQIYRILTQTADRQTVQASP